MLWEESKIIYLENYKKGSVPVPINNTNFAWAAV